MLSPPARPFTSPPSLLTTLTLPFPTSLTPYLPPSPSLTLPPTLSHLTPLTLTGLLLPPGITLLTGGGYHGKSTLLRTLQTTVHPTPPSSGITYCATIQSSTLVRSEDGRILNKVDVSPFISDLPSLTGRKVDTRVFSTDASSGSTSQAGNVVEALEVGGTVLLVDEDTSAGNFMARDGRMRALIKEEAITPLLYRVSGLWEEEGVSTVCVVGGNGDWLDVGTCCILMENYVAHDATLKMKSISETFSYGHVEYGGRGVVHRLKWGGAVTKMVRRVVASPPIEGEVAAQIVVDLERVEQLYERGELKRGCVAALKYLRSREWGNDGQSYVDMLRELEKVSWGVICDGMEGVCARPRMIEIGFALLRVRGLEMEVTAVEVEGRRAAAEGEKKRKLELAKLWEQRRGKKK